MDIFTPTDLNIGLLGFTLRALVKIPQLFARGYSRGISSQGGERKKEKNQIKKRVSFGSVLCQGDKARCCSGTRRWQLSTMQPLRLGLLRSLLLRRQGTIRQKKPILAPTQNTLTLGDDRRFHNKCTLSKKGIYFQRKLLFCVWSHF